MKICYFFLFLFVAFSCKDRKGYISKNENNGDHVFSVEEEDDAMNQAIQQAVKTYPRFLKAFNAPDSNNTDFSVKRKFAYPDGIEHMWLSDLHYSGDKLIGVLDSDPVNIFWIKAGDSLEIKIDSVSDWMYLRDNKLVGGYTMKVLYEKMSEAEKKEFASQLPFKME